MWRSLVAYLHGVQVVVGSNPATPTIDYLSYLSKWIIMWTRVVSCLGLLLLSGITKAVCPVCAIAVSTGVGLTQYLGVDDAVSGIWLGGMAAAVASLSSTWLYRRARFAWGYVILGVICSYLMILSPLYYNQMFGHPLNRLWGIDKLLLGILLGSTGMWLGYVLHVLLKHSRGNRVYFPLQKVVLPLTILLGLSGYFYWITR